MTSRTITKVLITQEDLALGQGTTTQTRQGANQTVTKIDLPWVVTSLVDVQRLDTTKYKHCILDDSTSVLLYRYASSSAETVDNYEYIKPNSGSGQWVLVNNFTSTAVVESYAGLRALTSSLLVDKQIITVTTAGISGTFVVRTGTVTDDDSTKLVFSDNSNRYAERLYDNVILTSWFGALGDGSTDDASAIQAAIDIAEIRDGSTVLLPMTSGGGDYRVTVTKGTNDKYGINIKSSNVTFKMEAGCQLRRQNSDINTYAKAFPLLLIGVPDSNSSQITNITLEGVKFYGENARHTSSGSALMDGRQAVWVKNVKGLIIDKCKFENIDSSAVWFQKPGEFDYENSTYYNNTKCYDAEITNCRFAAQSHAVAGRALIHTIQCNMDNLRVVDNSFEWCDVCVSCATSYDDYDDTEDDTYTDSSSGFTVKRWGRGYVIKGNMIYNSSEHCFYLNGMTISCTGNTISVDNATICNTTQFQIRGRGVSIVGNTLTGVATCVGINTGSMDVTFQGNSIQAVGDSQGGVINIQSQGLTAYIDNRSDYFASYKPQRNIVVANNTIDLVNASQTNGVGMRIYTDSSDANFPDGQMQNVIIKGNVINRPRKAILTLAALARNVIIESNIFNGKDFTESGFTTGTNMNSEYVLGIDDSLPSSGVNFTFNNNTIWGFEYVMFDDGGAGSAGTFDLPFGIRGNSFAYVKYWDTTAFKQPTFQTMFQHNIGRAFLDRTGWYSNTAIFNALSDGTSNSEKKTMLQLVSSSDVRFYYDDSGNFKAL